jgi:hypothetical protein
MRRTASAPIWLAPIRRRRDVTDHAGRGHHSTRQQASVLQRRLAQHKIRPRHLQIPVYLCHRSLGYIFNSTLEENRPGGIQPRTSVSAAKQHK